MKVADLIELLQDYEPDQEVMIAHQPNWPLAEVVSGVVSNQDQEQCCPEHEDFLVGHSLLVDGQYVACHLEPEAAEDNTVWLVAGGHKWDASPYAPRWVFEQ